MQNKKYEVGTERKVLKMDILDINFSNYRFNYDDDGEEIPFEHRCGLFKWRPDFLQRFRNIYLFLFTACIVCTLQTSLSAGYMSSQITTLERRFSLDSYNLGIIQSFFDVGFIFSVIFVGYFGGRSRIPRLIGIGMLTISLGALAFSVPQFISTEYSQNKDEDFKSDICEQKLNASKMTKCKIENKASALVKFIFIFGQAMIGSGSSPILSLSPTYIDDHVNPGLAPALIALLYASSALGPVLGFGLGAVMLKFPDSRNPAKGSKPGDHNWIGMWWGGYVILGLLCVVVASFLFMFPRRVKKIAKPPRKSIFYAHETLPADTVKPELRFLETDAMMENNLRPDDFNGMPVMKHDSSHCPSEPSVQLSMELDAIEYGTSIKDIPKAMWSLLTNKIFVVVSVAICFEIFLINGFAAFLPKYIEHEYKVSNVTSSLIAGGLIVPAGALGIVTGGLIMHKFQLSRRKAVAFSICGVLLVLVCMVLFFLFGCQNPPFAGITVPIQYKSIFYKNITNVCNIEKCASPCDSNQFSPLCDTNSGVTFFSGCHAGCRSFVKDTSSKKYFYNCSCTSVRKNLIGSSILKTGECPLACNSLITFVLFLTIALFLTGITQNPLLMVTIRSVKKHERSFALGFQFVILRIFGYIPSPIVYGAVIDGACVHWKRMCGERGDCLVTDLKLLNFYLIGLCFLVKCGAVTFYSLLYFIVPKHIHGSRDCNLNNIDNSQSLGEAAKGDMFRSSSYKGQVFPRSEFLLLFQTNFQK